VSKRGKRLGITLMPWLGLIALREGRLPISRIASSAITLSGLPMNRNQFHRFLDNN
jgi:hypothetical protein